MILRRKRTVKALCAIALLCILAVGQGGAVIAQTEVSVDPSVYCSAEAAVLIRSDGSVLYEKNADMRHSMASTTKIMTALIVIETLPPDMLVTVDDRAVGVEGSSMYLEKGESLTVRDLLYALMLQSANDAAAALAYECAGSIEDFAGMMNAKAEALGLENTHFTNPHGLDDPEHYTTARSLARLTAYAVGDSTFREIVSSVKYAYSTSKKSGVFVNHNKLLCSLEGCVGVKTGYTKSTGRCLVSATDRDGLLLICVTLNDPDDWRDHKALHDYGSGLYTRISDVKSGEFEFLVPVVGGSEQSVRCANTEDLTFFVTRGADTRCEIELPRFLYAPVSEGERCGRIVAYVGGEEVASVDITATGDVEEEKYESVFDKIINFIKGLFG